MNPNSKLNGLLGAAAAVALLPCMATPVHADQINTPGLVCQQALTGFGTLIYLPTGGAQFVANPGIPSTRIVCPIPRTPLAAGLSNRIFFIDGDNPPGGMTSCTITVFDFKGVMRDSVFNSSLALTYDMSFAIPSASLLQFDYAVAQCSVPDGGTVRGVTSRD